MEEKEILYKGSAMIKKNPLQTILSLSGICVLWVAVCFFSEFLPFKWLWQIAAIIFSAVFINKLLNKGTFTKTYILYEDKLVVITRYGLIEKESSVHPFSSSVFTETTITTDGVKYPFYPDKELIRILKTKTAS